MLSLTQSIEEFAAKRRKSQTDIEDALRPSVTRALDLTQNTEGWREVLTHVREQYRSAYYDDAGTNAPPLPRTFLHAVEDTLKKVDRADQPDPASVDRITVWLATVILSQATVQAVKDDPEELLVEWVDMHDNSVRPTHREANGQQRPLGEKFSVGGQKMAYPGDSSVSIELWINCRCTLRPVLAKEALVASNEFRDVPPGERKKDADAGRALPDGSYPIDNCQDLRNAIQAIGRASDPAKAKAHISKRKAALDCPDVELPEGWSVDDEELAKKPFPPKKKKDEEVPGDQVPPDEEFPPKDEEFPPPDDEEEDPKKKKKGKPFSEDLGAVPFHSVLAPEGIKSGDGRRFSAGSLRVRPLPLPLTWQKVSAEGHDGNVTVSKIEQIVRVGNEMRAVGHFISTPEADEVVGLIAEFGRFGVSIDADDATFELNEEDETVDFTSARIASACIVPIPAFAEAWVSLGEAPEGFLDDGEPIEQTGEPDEALVAAGFKDLAPGKTEDGPGWLTHPVDTERLRHYWVHGEGAAKIGWGTPGDFNRCRLQVAKYIKPQYLNGYCANRHYDALGFWPGRPVAADTTGFVNESGSTEGPALSLVASTYPKPPKAWFTDPELEKLTPLTVTDEGRVFGHLAGWDTCHIGFDGVCIAPPTSLAHYAYFLTGEVVTDGGRVPVGNITMGGGHAAQNLRARPAAAHYDSTSVAVGDVTVGEDDHGIWFSGWIRPDVKDEVIAELQASGGLSGDWRDVAGHMELIAALAVNVPGFPIPRVAASVENGKQLSLVAAGMVYATEPEPTLDYAKIGEAVLAAMDARETRKQQMAALAARVNKEA